MHVWFGCVGCVCSKQPQVPPGRAPLPWPSVHAPWYAYLMWTTAVAGGYGQAVDATLVAASFDKLDTCTANLKVS